MRWRRSNAMVNLMWFVRCSQNLKKKYVVDESIGKEREKKIRFDQLLSTRSSCDSNFEDDVNFFVIYLWKKRTAHVFDAHSFVFVCLSHVRLPIVSFCCCLISFGRRPSGIFKSLNIVSINRTYLSTVGWGIHVLHVLLILPFIHIAFEHLDRFEFPLDDGNDFEMWMMDWDRDRDTPHVLHVQHSVHATVCVLDNSVSQSNCPMLSWKHIRSTSTMLHLWYPQIAPSLSLSHRLILCRLNGCKRMRRNIGSFLLFHIVCIVAACSELISRIYFYIHMRVNVCSIYLVLYVVFDTKWQRKQQRAWTSGAQWRKQKRHIRLFGSDSLNIKCLSCCCSVYAFAPFAPFAAANEEEDDVEKQRERKKEKRNPNGF